MAPTTKPLRPAGSPTSAGPTRGHAVPSGSFGWGSVDLNLLIVFDAIIQDRSLTRAGRRLGLSQPATSHALTRLRNMLGDELFIRTPQGMQPTTYAEQMAEPVREALRLIRATLEPDDFDPTASTRTFNLVVNNYAARAVVPPLARRVAKLAPGVGIEVKPIGNVDVLDLLDRGTDVALTRLVEGGERFKCVRLLEDDFVALIDRNHPVTRETALTARHLAEIPHVVVTSTGDDTGFVDLALEQLGLTRRIAARVTLLSIVLMLIDQDRIAVLPRRIAVDLSRICPVVVRELPFASATLGLAMIWHRRLDNHLAQRWLRDTIRECLERGD
jgi:DNA-binding transcriptional LysR family regulator